MVRLRADLQQDRVRLAYSAPGFGRSSRLLLAALATLTTATLVLVLIDKPFRDPELPEVGDVLTLADKLMIFSHLLG